jgi:hypothetical protein
MGNQRVGGRQLQQLQREMAPREVDVLQMVSELRLVSGRQILDVHFPTPPDGSRMSSERVARRVLQRMVERRLLVRLERQVGGLRGGSESFIYAIGPVGQRLATRDGPRRRFREPSTTFAEHTLAVAELVVALKTSARSGEVDLLDLQPEPTSWRRFQSGSGTGVLRPDLVVNRGVGAYEHRWFVEVDLGTEHLPALLRKCHVYQRYFQCGAEQKEHGVSPRVCWALPDVHRAQMLRKAIDRDGALTHELFVCVDAGEVLPTVSGATS